MAKTIEELELENEQLRQDAQQLNQRLQKLTEKEMYYLATINYFENLKVSQYKELRYKDLKIEFEKRVLMPNSEFKLMENELKKYYEETFKDQRAALKKNIDIKTKDIEERILLYESTDGRSAEISRLLKELEINKNRLGR